MIALGFVRHPASMAGKMTPLDEDWLSDSTAKWAIDVNGEMISVTAHLNPPYLPIIQQESLSFIYSSNNLLRFYNIKLYLLDFLNYKMNKISELYCLTNMYIL